MGAEEPPPGLCDADRAGAGMGTERLERDFRKGAQTVSRARPVPGAPRPDALCGIGSDHAVRSAELWRGAGRREIHRKEQLPRQGRGLAEGRYRTAVTFPGDPAKRVKEGFSARSP